ncbi:MAG: hypothetical protein KDN19_14965 [Verrucomicrobiae bacterium]|nr:hypothetical protein [Verrucomicrobiae bacterium]
MANLPVFETVPSTTVTCPKCLRDIEPPLDAGAHAVDATCLHCRTELVLETFPRLTAADSLPLSSGLGHHAQEGEAVCHFYPELQAETVCEECGCFLSRKAAVEWGERTLCMPCLHQLRETKSDDAFSAKRSLHDNVALALVVFLLPLSLFTGPLAIFQLIRHRRTPGSLIPRSRFRWWLALTVAIAATAGWLILIILWIVMIIEAAAN